MAKYTYGSTKGGIEQGQTIADPWSIAPRTKDNSRYTSSAVVETFVHSNAGDFVDKQITPAGGQAFAVVTTGKSLAWTPVLTNGTALANEDDNYTWKDKYPSEFYQGKVTFGYQDKDGKPAYVDLKPATATEIDAQGNPTAKNTYVVNADKTITFNIGRASLGGDSLRVAYLYDNVIIPQDDIPMINVKMENIPLVAKARRIAVYYSQIAAFQAKTDYGFDMGKDLAEKACAELAFEIDEEIIHFLADMGRKNLAELGGKTTFNKALPNGVSKRDHYESFSECIENAKVEVYRRTQKFMPSYMLAGAGVLPILAFVPGFKPASMTNVAGPFFAGTLNGLKVFVSPSLDQNEWYLGVNGNDFSTSAAVYAPYMPIVPTQLLGYSDGALSQGFSTMYDLKALNPQLIVGGKIVNEDAESFKTAGNTSVRPVFTKAL